VGQTEKKKEEIIHLNAFHQCYIQISAGKITGKMYIFINMINSFYQ